MNNRREQEQQGKQFQTNRRNKNIGQQNVSWINEKEVE